jgi:hypothetical protein
MAFVNAEGKSISYSCDELIQELREDIAEFGKDKVVNVWCMEKEGVILYTNYDFIIPEQPVDDSELTKDEFLKEMTMADLLVVLEKQNKITA